MDDIPEDDYTLTPCGRLGGKTRVSQFGKVLDEFIETDDALKFIAEHMKQENYFPSIWWISDHGNAWQIDIEGNEIKGE